MLFWEFYLAREELIEKHRYMIIRPKIVQPFVSLLFVFVFLQQAVDAVRESLLDFFFFFIVPMDHIKVSEQQNMCPFDLFIYIFASKIKFQMPKIQNDTNFVNRYRERVHCLATKGHNIPSHDHLN